MSKSARFCLCAMSIMLAWVRVNTMAQAKERPGESVTALAAGASDEELRELFGEFETTRIRPSATVGERQAQLARFDQNLRRYSQRIFQGFWSGGALPRLELSTRSSREWVNRDFRLRIESSVTQEFFKGTLGHLAENGRPRSNAFVERSKQKFGDFYLSGFRIFSEFPKASGTNGGFSPGTGEVWVKLRDLSVTGWVTVFVHELSHALDATLLEAERSLSLNSDWWQVYWRTKSFEKFVDLQVQDQQKVRLLARSLLDRGLLSEVRAWTATLQILAELSATEQLRPGTIELPEPFSDPNKWLIVNESQKDLERRVIKALRPRFSLPAVGAALSSPALIQAIELTLNGVEACFESDTPPTREGQEC